MITNSDILEIFQAHVPTGVPIAVRRIHEIVEKHGELTAADWEPDPSEVERGHTYPSWNRKVQAALHTLKMKHKIQHFRSSRKYIFDSSSCC